MKHRISLEVNGDDHKVVTEANGQKRYFGTFVDAAASLGYSYNDCEKIVDAVEAKGEYVA
jgi:hypothetical protein